MPEREVRVKGRDVHAELQKRARRAASALAGAGTLPGDEAVHTARKQIKRMRALLRLARAGIGRREWRRENRALRRAGRALGSLRDAAVLVAVYRSLPRPWRGGALGKALESHRREARRAARRECRAAEAVSSLRAAERRLRRLRVRAERGAVRRGLVRACRECQRAMRTARRSTTDRGLHEWRKRAQDLRYNLEFLSKGPAARAGRIARSVGRLSDVLGQDHDLAALAAFAAGLAARCPRGLERRLRARRRELQRRAFRLGERLLGRRAKAEASSVV